MTDVRGTETDPASASSAAGSRETIRVVVRVRPLLSSDKDVTSIVSVPDSSRIEVLCGDRLKTLKFNYCAHPSMSQSHFYAECGVRSLLQSSLQGHNSTVFAYGQTGSGKTFTMSGTDEQSGLRSSKSSEGLIGRCTRALYDHIRRHDGAYICRASFCEIYNEKVYDLLNYTATPLDIRFNKKKGFYVQDLQVFQCDDESDIDCLIAEGHRNRRQSSHALNAHSSRSHALLTIYLRQVDRPEVQEAKINFIDLAGSEKVRATGVTGSGFKEATHINTSLFTLGRIISDLSKGVERKFITFRESALTKLLMDSLGGNTKTLMIACIAPGESHLDESLSTVEYASRAKNIVNEPMVQIDRNLRLLGQLQGEVSKLRDENARLREQLLKHGLTPLQDDTAGPTSRHSGAPRTAHSTQSAPETRVKPDRMQSRSQFQFQSHARPKPHDYHEEDEHWLPPIDAHKHEGASRYTYDDEAEESYVEEMLSDQDIDPPSSEAKWAKPKHKPQHGYAAKARRHPHPHDADSTPDKPTGYLSKYNAHDNRKKTDSGVKPKAKAKGGGGGGGGGYLAMYRKKQHR